MGRAARSQDFIASSVVFESYDYMRISVSV